MEIKHEEQNVLILYKPATPWMLWWAVGVHIIWASSILVWPSVANLAVFVGLNTFVDIGLSTTLIGIGLFLVASLAAFSLIFEYKLGIFWTFVCLMPQYLVLLVALIADIYLFVSGSYQGREVDRHIILVVLFPIWWGAMLHTFAILERYILRWHIH